MREENRDQIRISVEQHIKDIEIKDTQKGKRILHIKDLDAITRIEEAERSLKEATGRNELTVRSIRPAYGRMQNSRGKSRSSKHFAETSKNKENDNNDNSVAEEPNSENVYEEVQEDNSNFTNDPKTLALPNFEDPALWKHDYDHDYTEMILENWTEQNLAEMDFLMSKRKFGEQKRGVERTIAKKNLLRIKPFSYKSKTILKAKENIVRHGNLQSIKSDSTVRKIRSESLAQWDRDRDDIIDLIKMQREHNDYIKEVCVPFNVKIYKKNGKWPVFGSIVTDFSYANLHAISKACNRQTLSEYIELTFRISSGTESAPKCNVIEQTESNEYVTLNPLSLYNADISKSGSIAASPSEDNLDGPSLMPEPPSTEIMAAEEPDFSYLNQDANIPIFDSNHLAFGYPHLRHHCLC
ncbi:unnamed protein product [Phaedon cochleariae]|uniref:Uncharacterized protein n=1 Tax=Phaedon cochleariae TaxID=80249 RepID=A0A9N9SDU6_PHACE|nr:unnamed protein product [Phaedon cochleariae]